MPHTEFIAASRDEKWLVDLFFHHGLEMVPDIIYELPEPTLIRSIFEYESFREMTTQFFLLESASIRSPLVMLRLHDARRFAIGQRQGGPAITFTFASPFVRDGVLRLPSGCVTCFSSYKNSITGEHEKPPKGLRQTYRAITNEIENYGHLIEFNSGQSKTRKFWVLAHAWETLEAGARLVGSIPTGITVKGVEDLPWAVDRQNQ